MRHIKDPKFKPLYEALPPDIQRATDKSCALLKHDPKHSSLHFKRLKSDIWSVRVSGEYRALAIRGADQFQWFWIGTHADYDRLIR